jgi:uncharacterized FlaG/YvyC family protein
MQDSSITGVNKVAVEPTASTLAGTHGTEQAGGQQKLPAVKNETVSQTETHLQPQIQQQTQPQPMSGGITDVRLKFEVDEETNEVTCMVIDRASQKIIRTIPPDELKTLQEGDLVQLYT